MENNKLWYKISTAESVSGSRPAEECVEAETRRCLDWMTTCGEERQ